MVSADLVALARCPDCRSRLSGGPAAPRCTGCARRFDPAGAGYLDLRPLSGFAERTKYVDEALHADARHETVSPPLLSAGLRNDMLRRFLRPGPGDRVIDLGCGSGRTLVWNRGRWGHGVGVDAGPFFAAEARGTVDLALGDLRRLPFADAAFTKAYALDVLEHLSREALALMLREAGRVLEPGGQLFVYSHVRRNSRLALGLRWINRLAAWLERRGLIDLSQEHLRKSDHVNPLADVADLRATTGAAGFRLARIAYYTPLVGAAVENILMRLAERALAWRHHGRPGAAAGTGPGGSADALKAARLDAKRAIARGGAVYVALRGLTWLMKVDLLLFGRVTSGPFFALLVKEPAAEGR
jgi:ubiquinone/menaquinone biosynthesis C-methylase UbiE